MHTFLKGLNVEGKWKLLLKKLDFEFEMDLWVMMFLCILVGAVLSRLGFWLGGVIYELLKDLVKWMLLN